MRVYITDLEAYNNGRLVGSWYELPMNKDELTQAIQNELQKGQQVCEHAHTHEEYFISDFEYDYMKIDEYDSLDELNEIAQKIEKLDESEKMAVKMMVENHIVNSIDEAIENLENMICTGENSMEDIAYNYIEESGLLQRMPENLQGYFDYEALGRDMEIEGNYFRDENNILWEYVG
ncbi:antirestriction protein ArdA [Sulfurimonas paralvinellae]|uniref:Antirestriction protein ArdA n=1 Tax=Sulfurimonas paralvinellae TaxID=317658 RepID=A0A7M1B763_9BACT|nr:antirestriction protein ArdA [Sulfurimonas paralvinellae]QOP45543.1 antirestriction protein ArdA [Sulfurimonas paralvinellae]